MNKYIIIVSFMLILPAFSCSVYKYSPAISESDLNLHINFLASDELEGRYPGAAGDSLAGLYIQQQFREAGLIPQRQAFSFLQAYERGSGCSLGIAGKGVPDSAFAPFSFSADSLLNAPLVFAGYGISIKADSFSWNDYAGIDVKGKWVLALRGTPGLTAGNEYLEMASDDRDKAMLAKDNGAGGLLLVSGYLHDSTESLTSLSNIQSSAGIPVFHISRAVADSMLRIAGRCVHELETGIASAARPLSFPISVAVEGQSTIKHIMGITSNWYAVLNSTNKATADDYVLVGAHYDHLGAGGKGSSSRRQDTVAVHNGADDNASGVSVMLELAAKFKDEEERLKRSMIFVAFGGEEKGLLGSKYFVNHPPVELSKIGAMINLDMVGRLDTVKGLQVGGAGTSREADSLIGLANGKAELKLVVTREGSGPSDHSSFYARNIPVFFITTGAHPDYHTPGDDPEMINMPGMYRVTGFVHDLVLSIATHPEMLAFREAGPKENSITGPRMKVTLGFMPDFSAADLEGVRVDLVTKGKAAERGGIRNGDIITAIDGQKIKNIYDYMYRMAKLKKNQIISVELLRNGKTEVLLIQL